MSDSSDPKPNPVPFAGSEDFAQTLRRMQPRGRVWDGPDDSIMAQLRTAQTALLAQFSGRLAVLTETEAYPPTSVELLPVWNEVFGLPDPCLPLNPTVEQQQQALAVRLAQNSNLSRDPVIAIAAVLGVRITIDKYHAATVDTLVADEPVYDPDWAFTWQINIPAAGPNAVLECYMKRLSPPDSYLIFNYSG